MLRNRRLLLLVAVAFTSSFAGAEPLAPTSILAMPIVTWTEISPGVWSGIVGARASLTFRELAGAEPMLDALGAVGEAVFPFEEDVRGEVRDDRVSVRLPLGSDERVYGLGLQFDGINRRGEVWHLRVDHYGGVPGRTHAPVPFYVSSAGYGVLFNTPRWISVYPGVGNRKDSALPPIRDRNTDGKWEARPTSDAVEATTAGSGMEILVFAGPTPLDAVRRYNLYFGGGVLPPRWGLGFWHRTPANATAAEVTSEVGEYARRNFPLDVVGLEPGWQSKAYPCTFDWDTTRFPDPEAFVHDMTARALRVNLWENPYVSPESSMHEAIAPYTGSHTVWLGAVPDYTIPEARRVLEEHHGRTHIDIGVSGYKIDEVDGVDGWLWPDHATFPSGTSGEVMRQTYGLQLQQTLTQLYRERNTRTYGLVRGSNGGASAYPWVIYSDYYGHKGYIAALCNSSFAGVLWVPEIRSAGGERDWVRRMQSVCFSPMAMLNAWASGTKPWTYPEVEGIIRDTMQWRQRLLPYLYTAFARYHFEGIPPFRAMALEPGFVRGTELAVGVLDGERNPYAEAIRKDVDTQYFMGDDIIVAAMIGLDRKRDVVLPEGKWFDFYTGEFVGEAEVIEVSPGLDTIPLFVRDGGIVPLVPVSNNTSSWKDGVSLEIRHYGELAGTSSLYDDDGTTYDYTRGKYRWYTLSTRRGGDGQMAGTVQAQDGDFDQRIGDVSWRWMTK